MSRHSFIQMSKLSNVKGRISYISSHARQENLYAVYETTNREFWRNLAEENRQEFRRSGTDGKCIEARELIIALPECFTKLPPEEVLKTFTDTFKGNYGVECISALHHNKRKTNYHIHLIFAERTLLPEAEIKIASRAMYYDENGKHVRTKKEISNENGKLRDGCTVIKKGEIYEQHLFSIKNPIFKSEAFLAHTKEQYTELINRYVDDPELQLKVFNPDSVYLPTKKIGKHNPRAAEIQADNETRQEWNRTADLALVSGIPDTDIIEVRNKEIYDKVTESVRQHGWLPNLFRGIVQKAKQLLEQMIQRVTLPPKPTLSIDLAEFNEMKELLLRLRKRAETVKRIQSTDIPRLQNRLSQLTGLFKGKERKEIESKIEAAEKEVDDLKFEITDMVRIAGYPDGQAFMEAYNKAEKIVRKYSQELAEWKQQAGEKTKAQIKPPERKSVLAKLERLKAESKQTKRQVRYGMEER